MGLLWALFPALAGATLDPPLELQADDRFPALGSAVTFTITGPPAASFQLKMSKTPGEFFDPNWGFVFLDTSDLRHIAEGMLSPAGDATVVLTVPDEVSLVDELFYFQVKGLLDGERGVSNAISVRPGLSPPVGARQPEAVAATPDGTKVYVAHEEDGSISVIDALSDVLVGNIPIAPVPTTISLPMALAVDPEGRHLFVVDPRRRELAVIHVETDSVAGRLPVPASCTGIAFDFSASKRIYVTNVKEQAILVFDESPDGTFNQLPSLPLEGRGPGSIATLPTGELLVGHRHSFEIELVDPNAPPGETTIELAAVAGTPLDVVVRDGSVLVPSFVPESQPDQGDGSNVVLEIDPGSLQTIDVHLTDAGTDYLDGEASEALLVLAGSGSGSLVVADRSTFSVLEVIDLAPGEPVTQPVDVVFTSDVAGSERLYVVNHFRETVRPVDLSAGPPFALLPEIPLAHSGAPRVPLIDLTHLENGEWFFSTVAFFNGTPANPNPVTCNTCHPSMASVGIATASGKNPQALFDVGNTDPWFFKGSVDTLETLTSIVFNAHAAVGGTLSPEAEQAMIDFQTSGIEVPISPFLEDDGSLSPEAELGKALFEGVANCASCHVEPLFIPIDPADRTIAEGVGTGLVPANVPSLRGLWSAAPYLHNGSAARLIDVLLDNPNDEHGTTSSLTAEELDQLVAYLLSL